jgi:hypothetical protein
MTDREKSTSQVLIQGSTRLGISKIKTIQSTIDMIESYFP